MVLIAGFYQGLDWKELRRRYNPDFTSQYILGVLPLILEKIDPFLQLHLDQFATSGETFSPRDAPLQSDLRCYWCCMSWMLTFKPST